MKRKQDGIDVEGKAPGFYFYVSDFLRDMRPCSAEAKGVWADFLCYMHFAKRRGYLEGTDGRPYLEPELARMTGTSVKQLRTVLDELDRCGIYSRDENGTIFNRRMVRDTEISLKRKAAGKKGGNPVLVGDLDKQNENLNNQNPNQKPLPSSSTSSSTSPSGIEPPKPPTPDGVGASRQTRAPKAVLTPEQETWFAKIYPEYWRHDAKEAGRKAFGKHVATKEIANAVWQGIQRQKARMLARDVENRPQFSTWINQHRWEDEEDPQLALVSAGSKPTPFDREAVRNQRQEETFNRLIGAKLNAIQQN